MKYLVALQYWEGDRDAAHLLMDFLTDITPENNQYADFVIIHRFDSKEPDESVLKNLQKCFNKVYVVKGKEQLIGYPNGSNGLWANLVEVAYRKHTETATSKPPEWSEYKAVLGIEADCYPISKDWLETLNNRWDESNALFIGHYIPFNCDHPDVGHINGNAMFSIDLFKKVPGITGTPHGIAWDTYHAKSLKDAGWKSIKEIVSIWQTRTINKTGIDALLLNKCVLVHGVKDDSVIKIIRRKIKNEDNRTTAPE
jgi:hypothetical protein